MNYKKCSWRQACFITLLQLISVTGILAQATQNSPALIEVDSFAAKISREVAPQIIDVRTSEEFTTNHINGAITVNLKEDNYLNRFNQFDKRKPVFIYAIQNSRPDVLAKELHENGYENVFELKGGIAAWIGKGYPYYNKTSETFSILDYQKIIAGNKIVLVEIGTKYCGLCLKAKRMVDSLQFNAAPSYKTIELELYDNPRLVADLKQVSAVPTLLLYKAGKITWKRTGLDFDKEEIKAEVEKAQHDF